MHKLFMKTDYKRGKAKGRGFIGIMIAVACLVLILRLGIEQIIKVNIAQNESSAQANLKAISLALENYSRDHLGAYPPSLEILTRSQPPYLDSGLLSNEELKGYSYECLTLEPSGYTCIATPNKCRLSGRTIFKITTGGTLTSDDCTKRE